MTNDFKGKNVLVAGLGVFGGGVSTAKWLLKRGAKVTVTDLKTEKELAFSLREFTKRERSNITFVLGKHRESDFKKADVVVVNPGMPRESKFLTIAEKNGAMFENVASLFFGGVSNPSVGVTGTRGKSTTTSFIAQILSRKYHGTKATGASDVPLLSEFETLAKHANLPAVLELSSWQLELLPVSNRAPKVAVITNLYRDHQNRYPNLKSYAKAKANIFKCQSEEDFLVLNDQNEWTDFFVKQKPKGKLFYFGTRPLAKRKDGIYISKAGNVRTRLFGKEKKLFEIKDFEEKYGMHNVENLLAALLAVSLFDPRLHVSKKDVMLLKEVPFREEVVYKKKDLTVVNDSAATSPDATTSALARFEKVARKKSEILFITGGTDKNLDFGALARMIKRFVTRQNLLLLEGSGTKKLLVELGKIGYFENLTMLEFYIYKTLEDCVAVASTLAKEKKRALIIFSPATASFEKFKNEFDRGTQFNKLVKKYF